MLPSQRDQISKITMEIFSGLLLILLSIVWFYYLFSNPGKSRYYKWYSLQRNVLAGIILFLLGLAMMCEVLNFN